MKCELCAQEIAQDSVECQDCITLENYKHIQNLLLESLDTNSQKSSNETERPKLLFLMGNLCRLKGQIDQAISFYETAIKDSAKIQPEYYRALGVSFSIKGDRKGALEMIKKGVELCLAYPDYRNDLGAAYFKNGQYGEAETEFKESLRLNPKQANTHNNLALVYRKKGDFKQAEEEINEAIRLDPAHAVGNYELGRSYYNGGMFSHSKNNPSIALPTAKELADVYMMLQNYENAIRYYEIYLSLHPTYADVWVATARAYRAHQNIERSTKALEEALRINPNYQDAKTMLAQISNTRSES